MGFSTLQRIGIFLFSFVHAMTRGRKPPPRRRYKIRDQKVQAPFLSEVDRRWRGENRILFLGNPCKGAEVGPPAHRDVKLHPECHLTEGYH
jgi:hypothetical protein